MAQRDVIRVVDLMVGQDPLEVAHVAAPALLRAVEVGHDSVRLVLVRLLPRLQERGLLGDDELAEEFARASRREAGKLRPTPVDPEELASLLEGPTDLDEGWTLEIAMGRFWSRDALMHPEARLTDDERRILVDAFRYLAEHDGD